MGMTLLVTGANGFIGRNLLGHLAGHDDIEVIGADLQETLSSHNEALPSKFTYVSIDFNNGISVEQLGNSYRFDCIVHLAGILSKGDDAGTHNRVFDANVGTVLRVLELARAHRSRFFFPSTGLIYGNHEGPFKESTPVEPAGFYALSKHLAEQLVINFCRENNLIWTIFRIAVLYGPGQTGAMFIPSLVNSLLNGRELRMTKGEQARDFVYIDDLAAALEMAIEARAKGLYNIGTGIPIRMEETAKIVEKLTGKPGLLRLGAIPYRQNESWNYCLSSDKIRHVCGWTPRVSLEQGLQNVIAHECKVLEAARITSRASENGDQTDTE